MPKKLTPAQFKSLRNKWYDKLEASGFEDAEERDSQRQWLKAWHAHFWASRVKNEGLARVQAKADYYEFAQQLLEDYVDADGHTRPRYKFASKLERAVWAAHANAETVGPAAARLKISKVQFSKIVKKIKKDMHEHFGVK